MNRILFSSKSSEWETPQWLFDKYDQEYHFDVDVSATKENTKCKKFFSPEQDGLKQQWTGTVWMNPPYCDLDLWIEKAFNESLSGATVVSLVPARTDTKVFHKYILPFSGLNSSNNFYAYVAGIMDGEGCIRIDKGFPTKANRLVNPAYALCVSVKMTDKNLIEKLRLSFGGGLYTERFDYKKDIYRWEIRGGSAKEVLQYIYPYLNTKRSQAMYALLFQYHKSEKEGKKLTPEYLNECERYYNIVTSLKKNDNLPAVGVDVQFLKGRLKFNGHKNSAPFPSMIVIFKKNKLAS